ARRSRRRKCCGERSPERRRRDRPEPRWPGLVGVREKRVWVGGGPALPPFRPGGPPASTAPPGWGNGGRTAGGGVRGGRPGRVRVRLHLHIRIRVLVHVNCRRARARVLPSGVRFSQGPW